MRYFVAVLIFLLGNHDVFASSNKCRKSDHCTCIKTSEEYEFQCSSSNDDVVVIHATPDKYIKIDCFNEKFNLEILPNYTAGRIELFELRFCPLSQDGFFSVLRKFGIENLENLRLEDVVITNNSSEETAPVTKEFFQGLSSLQTLGISYLGSPLEIDAFDNLPNLTVLYLENNDIKEIGGRFRSLKYLKVLHLSCNSLTHIPDNTFQNLSELRQLHLWRNNLTSITKSYFSGLHNLESLELSRNYIQFIDDDAFSDLSELVDISLRENQLGHISSKVFSRNEKLFSIRMDYSFNVTLDDYAFANLKNLSSVNLEHSGLQNVPDHVFEGSENIEILKMQYNSLQDLPEVVFRGLKHLKELDLTGNNISSIADELFSSLADLEILKLGGNRISEINGNVFRRTKNVTKLYLNNNIIKTISQNSFNNNQKLIFMDVSNNLYDMKYEYGYPFMNCKILEELLLSGNQIDEFPSSIMYMVHLTKLDLSNNNITNIMVSELGSLSLKGTTIDLSNNKITKVDFQDAEIPANSNLENFKNGTMSVTTVFLSNNLLTCDCDIYDLVRYINDKVDPAVKMMVDLKLGDDKCASPDDFQHIKIKDLQPHHVSCPYPSEWYSSSDCQCLYRPFDRAVVVDCSYKNLTECPRIEVMDRDKMVEVNLMGNRIRQGPNSSLGYDNVINLYLSNNSIEQFEWVPPKTEILKLDGNRLKHLDSKVLKLLESTSNLTLSGNNWSCDCSAFEFQNFIRVKFGKESKDIVCYKDKKPLIEKKDLCKPISTLIVEIVVPILLFLVFTTVGTTLYFCYQEEIKIWLFEKKLLRWLVTEEELDKDKKFDIFLSYSHKDEDFVLQNLLPILEEGPDPYDICIHIRDFRPGEFITKQIADSVNDSRRTLVVLSNDFLESVWGKMEFRAAHTKAINEGRARVIVIKYGELDEEKLDEEMRMYLKTNTYVEWGKPWFWRKLRYALPHSRAQNIHKNQKHANMMLKIDDKFELTCPPLSTSESTPPVMGLDPAMLKNSPLSYKHSNKFETPPAETPLVIPIGRD